MPWIEKLLSLVSVPGYCFLVLSTLATATEVFYLKLTVPHGFGDLAPHTQDAPPQDAIKAHCWVTLCYLPTLSTSEADGLPSCPVRAFLVLSSFHFHFMLFQPHLTSSFFLTPTSLNQVTDQCFPQQGLPGPLSLTHDLCHFFMVYRLLGAVSFPFMGYHYQIVNLLFPTRW